MARRKSSKSGNAGAGAALILLLGVFFSCAVLLLQLLVKLGTWYINAWKGADQRGRALLGGGLAIVMISMCAIGSAGSPRTTRSTFSSGQAVAAMPSENQAVEHSVLASATPSPTMQATATPRPPTATALPPTLTPTPAPPVGQAVKSGNMRSAPKITNDNIVGELCADDQLEYVSRQEIDDDLWYLVRVTGRSANCGDNAIEVGTQGWVNTILVSKPSYSIESYAALARIKLPPKIISPTATPKPRPAIAPASPSSGERIGAMCRDGTRSNATGRGACSHHGGVAYWLHR